MFHKRNPQASFPGGNNAPGTQQQGTGVPGSGYGPGSFSPRTAAQRDVARDVRGPTSSLAGSANRPDANTKVNKPLNANNEGHSVMNTPNDNTASQSNAGRPMDIPGTMPYGRPMTPGAGYGASAGASYNPYGSGRKLIIGEGITMSGEIEHCDHLIVEGTVQATLKDAKLLDISEAGVFYGTVDIEEATIAGRFEGDLTVAGRLTVKATGVITGSIRYKELAIEAGASIEGTLSPTGPRKSDDTVAAADFSKGKAVAKQAREAAQKSGSELNFGDKSGAASAAQ